MWIFDKKYVDMLDKHSDKFCGRCRYYNGEDCRLNINANYYSVCNKFKWSEQMIRNVKQQERVCKIKKKIKFKIRY